MNFDMKVNKKVPYKIEIYDTKLIVKCILAREIIYHNEGHLQLLKTISKWCVIIV